MFWKSIISGLLVILTHWQVWIAVVVYVVINFVFLIIVTKMFSKDESGGRMVTGSLFYIIGGTILHGILMGLMIAFLFPILLGGDSAAPISGIIALLWQIIEISVISIVAITILSIIPLIGGFIANSPGVQAFLEGVIIFRLLSANIIDPILTQANVQGSVYPGLWESIGFIVIAGILVRLVMFGVALLYSPLEDTEAGELMLTVIAPVLGILVGIIPLFMYSSYVQLSIMQLIGE